MRAFAFLKRPVLAGLLCAATLASGPALATQDNQEPDPNFVPHLLQADHLPSVMERAVDQVIRPGYREVAARGGQLSQSLRALCAAPSPEELEKARAAFADTVKAWAAIEFVQVGPVLEDARMERILFFPDRKGLGLKQVQRILAQKDETALKPETLRVKSVAVQGLTALEFVLYGTGAETVATGEGAFRCGYGAAIATNIERTAAELTAAWEAPDGVAHAWKVPGEDNPVYRDASEAATGLLGVLVHGVENVRDQRIRPFLADGLQDGAGRPKQAIYWRSGLTMAAVSGNLAGLKRLFDVSDAGALLPEDKRAVETDIDALFVKVTGAAEALNRPVAEVLSDRNARSQLDVLSVNVESLLDKLNKDFGGAIGLTAGFSFADGD
ncbi:hypothetical protein BJF93_04515 [Xaviernesmea oryzae]|uniref:Imelysin-like domain-containing protein n=1 Tax=Xaviernesmea oryzae TaxID=464029 RepID=A0A1Q9AV36_9HYPH|nr:imelysin family protein [Xaviernesmea oryzae]OLP59315.1 hypothetical protein BJF93_04515 [Xaviernesmea oryzae]SEK83195.1 hypothetical protein SAMN04487976_104138 [Xaviernesmea oryzae]